MSKGRQYSLEFKQQAADLATRIGVGRAAEQLGISPANVQRWKSKGVGKSKAKAGENKNLEEENRRLQKENDELKKVNLILKRAAAFFSQDQLK